MEKYVRIYLKKYRRELLPLVLVVAGFLLLTWFILPQITEIPDLQSNIKSQMATNEGLLKSESTLNSISDTALDNDYEIALMSLPPNKSIGAIFQALTDAAGKSSVLIGSLNLQVGSVYDTKSASERSVVEGVPFLNLLVRVNGSSTSDLTRFAEVLYETIPIVEINSIGVSETEGRYDINFYFKPINEKGFQAQTLVVPLSAQQQELLNNLDEWSN